MPCFSASNVRLITATQQQQQQQQKSGRQDRPKTTTIRYGSETNIYSSRSLELQKQTRKQCENLFHAAGYAIPDASKFMRKGKYRQNIAVNAQQAVLPPQELNRLKTASKVVTLQEKMESIARQEEENKRLEEEAERVRQRFKEIDDERKRAAEANVEKEDLFGAGEKVKVLERAFLAKHEQEEEVKRVNRIILNAKCHAVRDAQIQEKSELEKGLLEEQRRLEKVVVERAIKAQNEEDEEFKKRHAQQMKYATEIKKQLNERENLRFLEAERIEAEAKMLSKASEAIKLDEEREARVKKERRNKFRLELASIVEMSQLFKKMLCEQEREADMKNAAYMRDKEARERALKLEKKFTKEEKERKQQRIYLLAQKALESRSQRDDMAYMREKERIEREYRRQEKEAAVRRRQIEKELANARERQLQETKQRQAFQVALDEQDFNKLIERLKQEEAKQKQLDDERARKRQCYRQDIIRQMNDKEVERRRLEELKQTQAFAWRESERQRDANIRSVINAKLAAMRDACLPEKYIKEVEQQMRKMANTKNAAAH